MDTGELPLHLTTKLGFSIVSIVFIPLQALTGRM